MTEIRTFADHLEARGLSTMDVHFMCDGAVSERTVRKIVKDGYQPSRGTVVILANGLDRSVAYLWRLIEAQQNGSEK